VEGRGWWVGGGVSGGLLERDCWMDGMGRSTFAGFLEFGSFGHGSRRLCGRGDSCGSYESRYG